MAYEFGQTNGSVAASQQTQQLSEVGQDISRASLPAAYLEGRMFADASAVTGGGVRVNGVYHNTVTLSDGAHLVLPVEVRESRWPGEEWSGIDAEDAEVFGLRGGGHTMDPNRTLYQMQADREAARVVQQQTIELDAMDRAAAQRAAAQRASEVNRLLSAAYAADADKGRQQLAAQNERELNRTASLASGITSRSGTRAVPTQVAGAYGEFDVGGTATQASIATLAPLRPDDYLGRAAQGALNLPATLVHGVIDFGANTLDLAKAGLGMISRGTNALLGTGVYEPALSGSVSRNYAGGMSYVEVVTRGTLGSNPVTAPSVLAYDIQDAIRDGRYGDAAEMGGTVFGAATLGGTVAGVVRGGGAVGNKTVPLKPGEFSIADWRGYPSGIPKPEGPFRLLEGAEQKAAEAARKSANSAYREQYRLVGQYVDVHEIQPIKFGGSPTDPVNKIVLDRDLHRQQVTPWWNQLMRDIKGP